MDVKLHLGRALVLARHSARAALDLTFPPSCVACGTAHDAFRVGPPLCPACQAVLVSVGRQVCRRCSAPVSDLDVGKDDCPHCRGSRFRFDGVTALGVYTGALRDAVLRMKRPAGELLALALGDALAAELARGETTYDLVVPMPMHWLRRLLRGQNNPELLAESISRRLRIPIADDVLRFRRNFRQQSTLAPTLRWRNVRRALAVSRAYGLAGAKILLVDDILTTGATASEAAKVLKRAGADRVHVAVAVRGIGFD